MKNGKGVKPIYPSLGPETSRTESCSLDTWPPALWPRHLLCAGWQAAAPLLSALAAACHWRRSSLAPRVIGIEIA